MYQVAESPQSIGAVLDDGFKLFGASLPKVVMLAFVGMLAGQLPNLLVSTPGVAASPEAAASFGTSLLLVLLLVMIVSALFYGAVVGRMNAVAQQSDMSPGEALSLAGRRLLPLVVFSVLYAVIVFTGSLLLLIPGIIFGVSLMFGMFPILLEGQGPIEGLKTSHRLVWGNWWRVLAIVSVASVIMLVVYLLVAFAAGFVAAFAGGSVTGFQLIELVLVPVMGALVAPLFYAITLTTYYDLRLRRSGADLEQRLGVPAEA